MQAFDRFKQGSPGDPRPYLYSGLALADAGRPEDAGMELNQVMQIGPQTPEQAVLLARVLDKLERPQLAEEILVGLQDFSKLDAEDHYFMASLFQRRRRSEKAIEALDRFVALRPSDRRAHLLRGEIHLQAGQLEAALSAFEKAVISDRQNALAQDGLGRTLRQGNNPEAAKKAFARALELDPGNPAYQHLLGLTCLTLGQQQEAITHLEEASRSPQASPRIFFDLGRLSAGGRERAGPSGADPLQRGELRARGEEEPGAEGSAARQPSPGAVAVRRCERRAGQPAARRRS